MGNVCSLSFSFDDTFSRCLDCTAINAGYVSKLGDNLAALKRELEKLNEVRNDIKIRVIVAEQKQMKRLHGVQGWLSRVKDLETEAAELQQNSDRELEQLCLVDFCSKNWLSSYKFGKQVVKTRQLVDELIKEGDFKDVAQMLPENPVDERPITSTVVGLQLPFEKVWRYLTEEQTGIIGIHGMGGVGKTTLLTQINNKFADSPNNFDFVIWAVASKDLQLQNIQESIAKKIGLFNESWKSRTVEEKAREILKILSKKKYLLLLDDPWEEVDLTKVGLHVPSRRSASHIIFTTRDVEVCGKMETHECVEVECVEGVFSDLSGVN